MSGFGLEQQAAHFREAFRQFQRILRRNLTDHFSGLRIGHLHHDPATAVVNVEIQVAANALDELLDAGGGGFDRLAVDRRDDDDRVRQDPGDAGQMSQRGLETPHHPTR